MSFNSFQHVVRSLMCLEGKARFFLPLLFDFAQLGCKEIRLNG